MTTAIEVMPGAIAHPEIEDLCQPTQRLLTQLAPNINAGAYTVILGDDASGRIPTLILRRVVGNIYQRLGFPEPQILFFTPWNLGASPELFPDGRALIGDFVEFTRQARISEKTTGKKLLVVTDCIVTGWHLFPYLQALHKMSVQSDIATIVAESERYASMARLDINVYRGWKNLSLLQTDRRSDLSGIKKAPTPALFAVPAPRRESVRTARHDVEIVADRLTQWYIKQHLSQTTAA